jgi:prevent-host-death family protein
MSSQPETRPITELGKSTAQLVRAVASQHRTLHLTENGATQAVLMDATTYESWRNAAALLQLIAQSEADAAAGHLVPQDEAFARAARALEQAASKA